MAIVDWAFDGPEHYGRTDRGERIGPYDTAEDLARELDASNAEFPGGTCERCEIAQDRGDLFWLGGELCCDACVSDWELEAACQ